jgi:SAM-dependent methyltransferase
MKSDVLTTQAAKGRGERLYPPRSSRTYWLLTCLRQAIEEIICEFFPQEPSGCLVDYGCGNMPYRSLFEPRVKQYIGCDFPGNEIADRIIVNPDRVPVDDASVDYVISTQVLEHVADPSGYLGECWRMLNERGLLILSTHGIWHYHPDPCDFWRWTSEGLKKVVGEAGFEVIRFHGLLSESATAMQLWQDEVMPHLHWRLEKTFTSCMQYVIEKVDRRCDPARRDASASVFLVVARKA